MLSGKKTYILSIIGGIVAAGNLILKFAAGEPISMGDIMAVLGAFGIGTLRAGMNTAAKNGG